MSTDNENIRKFEVGDRVVTSTRSKNYTECYERGREGRWVLVTEIGTEYMKRYTTTLSDEYFNRLLDTESFAAYYPVRGAKGGESPLKEAPTGYEEVPWEELRMGDSVIVMTPSGGGWIDTAGEVDYVTDSYLVLFEEDDRANLIRKVDTVAVFREKDRVFQPGDIVGVTHPGHEPREYLRAFSGAWYLRDDTHADGMRRAFGTTGSNADDYVYRFMKDKNRAGFTVTVNGTVWGIPTSEGAGS